MSEPPVIQRNVDYHPVEQWEKELGRDQKQSVPEAK